MRVHYEDYDYEDVESGKLFSRLNELLTAVMVFWIFRRVLLYTPWPFL
jgi:hypothetical protein